MKKRILALLLALTALLLSACGGKFQAQDLMTGIQAQPVSVKVQDPEADALAATEFSVRLFQACLTEGENTLVSPLSVLCALAMTANGAQGDPGPDGSRPRPAIGGAERLSLRLPSDPVRKGGRPVEHRQLHLAEG